MSVPRSRSGAEGRRSGAASGRKRFIVTGTLGRLVTVWVLAASWQNP
ncbi:hypothetical protein [Micromonospora sp. ATCC 39149]|uniref:Uncharacterized protein n=1 Tax=Micromonospora carbonacea TaxID=47853 RepID=A0A7D5YE22_9ACTN|nr:hypothetical protein [Micromonospora sp. ATCC 39149]QLJ99293.1 hypothetical protein HZU44_03815 [Micromonospora carbonacea]